MVEMTRKYPSQSHYWIDKNRPASPIMTPTVPGSQAFNALLTVFPYPSLNQASPFDTERLMASTLIPIRPLAVGLAALPAIYLAVHVYGRVSTTPRSRITTRKDFSASLRDSAIVTKLVNPRGHILAGDTRSIDLDVSDRAARIKDEAILAAFTRGFFGGSIFAPEKVFLNVVRPKMLYFPGSSRSMEEAAICSSSRSFRSCQLTSILEIEEAPVPLRIWDTKTLDAEELPPKHAVLFGVFQVGDISLRQDDDAAAREPGSSESTIDMVYGSNRSRFAGVHRFSVSRFADRPGTIRISFQSAICNPLVDQDLQNGLLFAFHTPYAAMLFRESVGEVQRRIEMEGE